MSTPNLGMQESIDIFRVLFARIFKSENEITSDLARDNVNNIAELNENYKGISEILRLWFTNYKGSGKMVSEGYGDRMRSSGTIRVVTMDCNAIYDRCLLENQQRFRSTHLSFVDDMISFPPQNT